MALIPALKRGLYLAGRIDKKYNLNKIFIDKYAPPGYRKGLYKLVDIAGTLGGGYGIVRFIESLYAADSPGNGGQIPFKKKQFETNQSYKTRRRPTKQYNRCRDQYRNTNRYNRYSNASRY